MSRLYNKAWAIEIGRNGIEGTRYEDLDMRFTAKQNNRSKPTTCDITIFNPSDDMVSTLSNKDALVKLYAGYEEGGAVEVAQGVVVVDSIEDRSKSQDPQISFQISKGREIFAANTLSKAWSKVTASEIIEYIRQEIGAHPDVIELASNPSYSRGYVLQGSVSRALSSIVKDCGCQYTLIDGGLRIWPIGELARELADIWAADTGLLEAMPQGSGDNRRISATALMRPGLRPGDTIQLESDVYNGQVICIEVTHDGDTYGDSWYTTIIGEIRG